MTNPELAVIQVPYGPKSGIGHRAGLRNVLIVHSLCVPCLALALGADTRPTPPPPAVCWTPQEFQHQHQRPEPARPSPTEIPFAPAQAQRDSTFWRGIAGRKRRRAA